MDSSMLRIGEIAGFFNVSVKAIRIYEKLGILKPDKIDPMTGYRYYAPGQVKQLDAILELRELGFSLNEIKKLLEKDVTEDQYMDALVHKKAMWQDKVSLAQDKIDTIEEIIRKLAESNPSVKLHTLTEDERAHLLSRMVCLENLHGKHVLSEAIWL